MCKSMSEVYFPCALFVRCDDMFQLVDMVSSADEAKEMAANYRSTADIESNDCPPEYFELHNRNEHGRYRKVFEMDVE